MAHLYRPDGVILTLPTKKYTLQDLQAYVKGYIEVVRLTDGRMMIVNENGISQHLAPNMNATLLYQENRINTVPNTILGNAVVLTNEEFD